MIRNRLIGARCFSSNRIKPFFVTTPIFYVNALSQKGDQKSGIAAATFIISLTDAYHTLCDDNLILKFITAPHIGHLYSAVIADAVNRYRKLRFPEEKTIFSTGTDEHGTKIQRAANTNKIDVYEYCNKISSRYKEVFKLGGVDYTTFIRTTDQRHKESVQHFWNHLKTKGHIYSAQYSGWYCVSDEVFLTENQLKEDTNKKKVSLESGHPVEWTEEVNYMFKLEQFQDDIIHWITSGERIKPKKFEKILLDYLEEKLPDISISRPTSRVHWGIPVPEDETQTVYVWLDALVNYLTCAGYPNKMYKDNWPPTHVIGKDILKFHGVYWPAFLIAAGMEPPQKLLVHSHWTVDGQKMSKSKHNVVDPIERAQVYTMEGLRYFLLREGVSHSDGNYSEVKIFRILNAELADTLGNLLSRTCAKSLNPRQVFPKISDHHLDEILKLDATKRLMDAVIQLPEKCAQHYEMYNFYLVIDQVMATLHAANNFFESCKPWELKKCLKEIPSTNCSSTISSSGNHEDIVKLETIISITMDTLRKCAIILQPVVPFITKKLLNKLNVPDSERCWDHVKMSAWDAGGIKCERRLGDIDAVLFRRIVLEKDEKIKMKVKKSS